MTEPFPHPIAETKSVNQLLDMEFFIPSYQRGYRWTHHQVEALLNDVAQFKEDSEGWPKKIFYCIQPLVVKARSDGSWEVIDGQQRLTTIYLILKAMPKQLALLSLTPFELKFETRQETSESFLQEIDPEKAEDNVDFFHISKAYQSIQAWLSNLNEMAKLSFLQTLINDNDTGKNVKFIWYKLPSEEPSVEAFTRLNVGKIPLTNSELIRALFLRSDNFSKETEELQQIRIAQEWDLIEKTLQASEFWYFIHSGVDIPANRIEYLFNLLADAADTDEVIHEREYRSFHYFNKKLSGLRKLEGKKKQEAVKEEWLEVKRLFMRFEEWFRDRRLYHLVGFLVHIGITLNELKDTAAKQPKSTFDQTLRARIFEELFGETIEANPDESLDARIGTQLDNISYGSKSDRLRSILLLFNIATLLDDERSNLRFPFDCFKKEKWDIEHIRSVDSDRPDRPDEQKQWLSGLKTCYSEIDLEQPLLPKIEAVLESQPFDKVSFNEIYDAILKQFGEDESTDADNRIENLTLLDSGTNRSYKNAVFPVKRSCILALDRSGIFVPLCTRNIFLKCYSSKIDDMLRWNESDKRDYRKTLVDMLARFFNPEK